MNQILKQIFSEDCYMLDVESTGLDIFRNGITSFALVKFNLHAAIFQNVPIDVVHCKISDTINGVLRTEQDESNKAFRAEHGIDETEEQISTLNYISNRTDWERITTTHLINYKETNNLFALHPEFDVAFIKKYFNHLSVDFPFPHRNIWDVASLCAGQGVHFQTLRRLIEEHDMLPNMSWLTGDNQLKPHHPVYDCLIQIRTMFDIMRGPSRYTHYKS